MSDFDAFFASEPSTAQSEVHKKEFDIIPDGEYDVSLLSADLVTNEKGVKLDLAFRVVSDGLFNKRRLWKSLYFYNKSEGNVKFIKIFMSTLGASLSGLKSQDEMINKVKTLVGSNYKIKVYASEYNGRAKNEFYLNKKIEFVTSPAQIDKDDDFGFPV